MRLFNAARARAAILCVLLASAGASFAQGTNQVAPEKLEAARDLLAATNADAQFTTIIPLMFRQMRRSIPPSGPNYSNQVDQVFDEIEKQFLDRRGEIIDQIAVLYASKFTVEEMNTLADFYRSPVGQKFIEAMPQLASEAMALGNAWGQKIAQEAEEKIRDELQKRGLKL